MQLRPYDAGAVPHRRRHPTAPFRGGGWAGTSEGLGYVMLNANAWMQTNLMFAALVLLAGMTILLWVAVDVLLKKLLHWAPEG
jgi:ABC-type nitrate/sulfonate/bicarbonate transport system permease component